MKKFCALVALLLLLTGCGKGETPATPASPAPTEPLHLKTLTLELQRSAGEGTALLKAVKELPAALQSALAAGGVTVEEVTVTVGSGAAATAEGVLGGSVDAAILPAAELAALEEAPCVLLAAGGMDEGTVGQRMLLCAADTEYGRNLAGRKAPTWRELDRARWGVVSGDLHGRDAVELWLADNYQGSGLEDLTNVTVYNGWDALLAAAEQGEVDVFPATAERLEGADYAVLGETERLYTAVLAVKEELADPRFAAAMATALDALQQGEFGPLFGSDPYAEVTPEALDPQRRIAVLMG